MEQVVAPAHIAKYAGNNTNGCQPLDQVSQVTIFRLHRLFGLYKSEFWNVKTAVDVSDVEAVSFITASASNCRTFAFNF